MCVLCVHPDHTHQAHKPLVSSIGRNPNHFVVVPATFFYLSTLILSLYTEGTTTYLRRFSCSCIMSVVFSSCDLLQLLCGRSGSWACRGRHTLWPSMSLLVCIMCRFMPVFCSWCLYVELVKHSKASSPPSPFDQVSYQIFTRCPSHCWTSSTSVGWLHTSQQHGWDKRSAYGPSKSSKYEANPPNFLHWEVIYNSLQEPVAQESMCRRISWLLPLGVLNTRA